MCFVQGRKEDSSAMRRPAGIVGMKEWGKGTFWRRFAIRMMKGRRGRGGETDTPTDHTESTLNNLEGGAVSAAGRQSSEDALFKSYYHSPMSHNLPDLYTLFFDL
jgi:hypothetical protein